MIATRFRNALLYLLGGLFVYLLLTMLGNAVAHGATDPIVEAPPAARAPGWSMGEVMALIALIVAGTHAIVEGVRAALHFTAPRTKTTLDDRGAAVLDSIHDRLVAIETLLPAKAPPPAPSSTTNIIGPIAMLVLVLGLGATQLSCAGRSAGDTLKAAPGALKSAAVDCTKENALPAFMLAAKLGAQATVAQLDQGAIDWNAIEEAAWSMGKVIGGCALHHFVTGLSQAPRSDTAVRSLVARPDPVADGNAAIARLSARFDGAVWQ